MARAPAALAAAAPNGLSRKRRCGKKAFTDGSCSYYLGFKWKLTNFCFVFKMPFCPQPCVSAVASATLEIWAWIPKGLPAPTAMERRQLRVSYHKHPITTWCCSVLMFQELVRVGPRFSHWTNSWTWPQLRSSKFFAICWAPASSGRRHPGTYSAHGVTVAEMIQGQVLQGQCWQFAAVPSPLCLHNNIDLLIGVRVEVDSRIQTHLQPERVGTLGPHSFISPNASFAMSQHSPERLAHLSHCRAKVFRGYLCPRRRLKNSIFSKQQLTTKMFPYAS